MRFSQIVKRIENLRSDCRMSEIAQLSILAINTANSEDELTTDEKLVQLLQDMSLRLNQTNDQHAAVTEELRKLAESDPKDFQREQIWTLIRAINVQDQLLHLYAGLEPLDA